MGVAIFTSLNMASVNMNNTVDAYYKQNNFADLLFKLLQFHTKGKTARILMVLIKLWAELLLVPMITDNQNENKPAFNYNYW